MRALLPSANAGNGETSSQITAPAKTANGNRRRPWNRRTPFQIMPQAMNISAEETSGGTRNRCAGALHSAIAEAPIR